MVALSEHDTRAHRPLAGQVSAGPQALGRVAGPACRAGTEHGWLSDELIVAVAKYLDLPPVWAYEVASFYSMFETEQVGRNNVAFCTNISCWLNGAEDLVAHAEKKLGCKLGETTADGRIFLKREEECLAACCGAPMMVVNGHYHENLDAEKVDECWTG